MSSKGECELACHAPPPPPTPPTPPPTPPPLSTSPCIRFIHALPVTNHVDVEITQTAASDTHGASARSSSSGSTEEQEGGISESMVKGDNSAALTYTWSNYRFGQHSNWVSVFKVGTGTLTLWENLNGQRGRQLFTKQIPLTPGPLVVALKVASDQDPGRTMNSNENVHFVIKTSSILGDMSRQAREKYSESFQTKIAV
jgi:hypothetical protein